MPIVFAINLVVLQGLLVLVHLAVYQTIAEIFGFGNDALKLFFFGFSGSFLVTSFLAYFIRRRVLDWLYAAAAYWFGLIHSLLIASAGYLFIAPLGYSWYWYISPRFLAGACFAALFGLHLYGTWKSGHMELTTVNISLPNLPAAWRGKRGVWVSDLHLGGIRKGKFVAKVVRKVQALAPDMVFIGGDLFDGPRCDVRRLIAPLRDLRAPKGIYFVTGNHEYFMRKKDLAVALDSLAEMGIRILKNENVEVEGLCIVGVDDKAVHNREDLARELGRMEWDRKKPSILLKHEPSHLEVAAKEGISLVLAGHTHNGQIFPLHFMTRAYYKGFNYGLKRFSETMQVYTSSGVGTWGPPLRLGTKSEIVEVVLV